MGILGSDLIGFHTYDYVRHFVSSVKRILGFNHSLYQIDLENRKVQVETYPMGIDYDYFFNFKSKNIIKKTADKIILSVDRLDYTKGVKERILSFSLFLEKHKEYHYKVKMYIIVAPSRVDVESYNNLKNEIEMLVSQINGKYENINWMPIWFFFRSFSQEELIDFYRNADVLLVTPYRDGMNLIAKEYIAAKNDYQGMVVISETTGAASELTEAIIVNVNNHNEIADGIYKALAMENNLLLKSNKTMHKRLKYYNVTYWAEQFLNDLNKDNNNEYVSKVNILDDFDNLKFDYLQAKNRIFLLDYDGTLTKFYSHPREAKPTKELLKILTQLSLKNTVVIISGRDRFTLDEWFKNNNINLISDHGLWMKKINDDWKMTINIENDWMDSVKRILEMYTVRMPGSLIEEKEYSIAWHYRQCEVDIASIKLVELKDALTMLAQSLTLDIHEGNKVLEIKDKRVNKGYGASVFCQNIDYDFYFSAGDDLTDEDLFQFMGDKKYSIKVGYTNTKAKYSISSSDKLLFLIEKIVELE